MEHFDLTEEEAIDPLDANLINRIKEQTKTNTEIYREVFACYPDDTCETM